ncbi:MAG: Sporulation kinase A [Syntrophorhabdus sp. PtaB.Bin047]|nr:MAG: Sporulation kinase A [Syntrophorhabdus sp. PtaB.Bin047]
MTRLRSLRPGDYHCFLYESESEANAFGLSFIRQGLDKREKVIYFAADHSAEALVESLRQDGVDVDSVMKAGQLQVEKSEPDSCEKIARDMALIGSDPLPSGDTAHPAYTCLRIAVDDTLRLNHTGEEGLWVPAAIDRLEAMVSVKCVVVFMYGLDQLSPDALFRVLATYPTLIIGDDIYENFLFRDPVMSGQKGTKKLKAEHLLDLLKDHRKLKDAIRKGGLALRASEDNYRSIFESAANLIAIVDKKGRIVDCNGKIREVLGYEKEEVIGRSIAALFHPDHLYRAFEILKEVVKKGSSYNKQYQMVKKDGSTAYVSVNSTPLKNERGKIARVVSVVEDITERKRVEEALFESERRFRQLVEILPDAILTLADGRIIFANSAAYNLFGVGHPRDLIGRRMEDFLDAPGAEAVRKCFEAIQQNGKTGRVARVATGRADGSVVIIEWSGMALNQKEGGGILFMGRDVTESEAAEKLVRESEERYRIAVENSNDGVAIVRGENYVYVNKKLAEMFGYRSANDVVGKNISVTIHPDDRKRVLTINHMRQRGEKVPDRYEFKGMHRDGSIIFIEVSATPVVYNGEAGSLVYLRDITARKEMEDTLRMIGRIFP